MEATGLPPVSIDTLRVEGAETVRVDEVREVLRRHGPRLDESSRPLALRDLGLRLLEHGLFEAELEWTERGVRLREGPAALWDTLYVTQPDSRDSTGAEVPSLRGPFAARELEGVLWDWAEGQSERGHPFATASIESLVVRDGQVTAGLRCDAGPRVQIEGVRFPGRTQSRGDFLRAWIRFRPGQAFRASDWQARRRRLAQSGLFLDVGEVRITPAQDGKSMVYIPVEEGPHNRLEGVAGVAGESSTVSGYASVELGNLFGTGRRLGLRWERIQEEQTRFRLAYTEPLLLGLPIGLRGALEQQVQDSTYTLDRLEVLGEALIGWDFFVSVGLEARRAVLGAEPAERITRVSTVLGGRWDFLDPVRFEGGRFDVSFRTGTSKIRPPGEAERRQRLDRVEMRAERFLTGRGVLTRLGILGAGLSGSSTDSLAVSEALWVGGTGSVRGYREEAFATRRYAIGQVEAGLPLPGEGGRAYLFADLAWFRRLAQPGGTTSRVGYGVGISSASARRTLGLDFGIPQGSAFRDGRIHLRLETRF